MISPYHFFKNQYFTFIICQLMFFSALSQQQAIITHSGKKVILHTNGTWNYADSISTGKTKFEELEIPKSSHNQSIIHHTGFSLAYNEKHEQANWVAYELAKAETIKLVERNNQFKPDPNVATGSATDADYKASGFDRGHLAPAADMAWSELSMQESFFYSNMSPQHPSFNRGIWKKLEELVRTWAFENESIYVVTGPILRENLPTIGPNQVSIPEYFYKVILDYQLPEIKAIGFILPNEASKQSLTQYIVSVDSVEQITGLDFFWKLPDIEENEIEKKICINCWTWKFNEENKDKSNTNSQAIGCKGTTKAGDKCRNNTKNENGFCHLHQPENVIDLHEKKTEQNNTQKEVSVQCSGTTKAGNRCKRMTLNSNGRCYQH